VYKLELWILGFITDSAAFLRLRKGTFRSHPTSELSSSEDSFVKHISSGEFQIAFDPILSKLDTDNEKWRRKLFVAYFSDINTALQQYKSVLREKGMRLSRWGIHCTEGSMLLT